MWLATDQSFKAAVENYSKKQAFMSRLARQQSISDFRCSEPTVSIELLQASRLDESELGGRSPESFRGAAPVSAAHSSRVIYHLIYDDELLDQYRRN